MQAELPITLTGAGPHNPPTGYRAFRHIRAVGADAQFHATCEQNATNGNWSSDGTAGGGARLLEWERETRPGTEYSSIKDILGVIEAELVK